MFLTERYFGSYGADYGGYVLGSRIALLIEQLVGRNNMERLYFSSDLYTLCQMLEQYLSKNEIEIILKKN